MHQIYYSTFLIAPLRYILYTIQPIHLKEAVSVAFTGLYIYPTASFRTFSSPERNPTLLSHHPFPLNTDFVISYFISCLSLRQWLSSKCEVKVLPPGAEEGQASEYSGPGLCSPAVKRSVREISSWQSPCHLCFFRRSVYSGLED